MMRLDYDDYGGSILIQSSAFCNIQNDVESSRRHSEHSFSKQHCFNVQIYACIFPLMHVFASSRKGCSTEM